MSAFFIHKSQPKGRNLACRWKVKIGNGGSKSLLSVEEEEHGFDHVSVYENKKTSQLDPLEGSGHGSQSVYPCVSSFAEAKAES